jgi:hypothetical protein
VTYLAAGAGALGAGLLLLSGSRRLLMVGFVALATAEAALLLRAGTGAGLLGLFGSAKGLVAAMAGAGIVGGLAALFARRPVLVAPLALVAAPLRAPVAFGADAGGSGVAMWGELGRLIPLYVVLAGGVLALLWRAARGDEVRALPRGLAVGAAAFVAMLVLSSLWSRDSSAAVDQLIFFVLPFAALLAALARAPVEDPRLGRLLLAALVIPAIVFAAVGLWQAASGAVFFSSPGLEAGNAYGPVFRVTSLFDDPSHYGRHLAAAIAVVLAALWLGRVGTPVAATVTVLLGAGLYFSYSQSSIAAVIVAALGLAIACGGRRTRLAVAAGTAAVVVAGAVAVASELDSRDGREVTSGRSGLVASTARVFLAHPVAGVGLAAQPAVSRELVGGRRELRRHASHTTPLTVAAELGVLGLAAYLVLLVVTVRALSRVRARDPSLGLGLSAVLLVLFVHSLFYEGFFDNPITWGAIGLTAAAASPAAARQRKRAVPQGGPGGAGPPPPAGTASSPALAVGAT